MKCWDAFSALMWGTLALVAVCLLLALVMLWIDVWRRFKERS